MKTIRFLRDCLVKDHRVGSDRQESYAAGQVVTLSDASAQHWLNRQKAEECEMPAPPPPAPQPVPTAVPVVTEEARKEMEHPTEELSPRSGRLDRRNRR